MHWITLPALLAQQTPQQQKPQAQLLGPVGMFLIMGFMLYFLILRPQHKKAKDQEVLLKALKPGDKVVTSGGICGVVVSIKDKTVTLRSADAKLEVLKGTVAELVEKAGGAGES
jgi:preprotein translocase subunit YajC